jgi:hypothetical protein
MARVGCRPRIVSTNPRRGIMRTSSSNLVVLVRAVCAAALPLLLLLTACGSGNRSVLPTPSPALAPTLTPSAVATQAGGTAASAAPSNPAPSSATPSASGTPLIPLITVTPLPQLSNEQLSAQAAPCKIGQIKGNQTTRTLYVYGLPGYNDLHANVQCFDSIDSAQAAGYHLPGSGG